MTATKVNNGTYANDPTADPLYDAFNTINDNYDLLGTAAERDFVTSAVDTTSGRVVTTGYDATKLSGLGTAAPLNAVTSDTDVTANRLLKVGAKIDQLNIENTNVKYEAPIKPTLDLDFANQDFTIYSKTGGFVKSPLADLVSQGRATAGSSTDAIGGITEFGAGENRFTFDVETGEALGYLSEESRTNYILYSDMGSAEAQTSTTWNFAVYDEEYQSAIAPDGTLSALKVSRNGVSNTPAKNLAAPSTSINFSLHVKASSSEENSATFLIRNSTSGINFSTGSVNLITGEITGANWTSKKLIGGWFRISFFQTTGISIGDTLTIYYGSSGVPPASLLPFYMWGAQLE